jgi:hypothetical protein
MFINMKEMQGSVGKDCIFIELTLVAMLSAGQYGFTSQSLLRESGECYSFADPGRDFESRRSAHTP